jgi:hypothetical protein
MAISLANIALMFTFRLCAATSLCTAFEPLVLSSTRCRFYEWLMHEEIMVRLWPFCLVRHGRDWSPICSFEFLNWVCQFLTSIHFLLGHLYLVLVFYPPLQFFSSQTWIPHQPILYLITNPKFDCILHNLASSCTWTSMAPWILLHLALYI